MRTKLSRTDMHNRNSQIFEMRKSGSTQNEIAKKFDLTPTRVGQILSNYKNPSLKNKALSIIEQVTKKDVDLVDAVIRSDMMDFAKLELLKKLLKRN